MNDLAGEVHGSVLADRALKDSDDDAKMRDEMLMLRLLAGLHVDKRGREITRYLKSNSPEERQARAVLAREVRSKIPGIVGDLLALAIDPRTPSRVPGKRPTRYVRFESPHRGRPSTWARDQAVLYFIQKYAYGYRGEFKTEALLQEITSQFPGIGRSRAHQLWKQYEAQMQVK